MIGEELVFFSSLYIKLSELGVEVALNHRSAVTHHKVCVYASHIHPHTLPPASKKENTQATPLFFLLSRITPHAKQQVLS